MLWSSAQAPRAVGRCTACILWAVFWAAGLGCDAPARVHPWRNAPNEATASAGEAAIERSGAREIENSKQSERAAQARAHTLRIAMDGDPGRLFPLASGAPPSTWARRIMVGPVFETLLRFAPPEIGAEPQLSPGLARSFRVIPAPNGSNQSNNWERGGGEIRLELEPAAQFQDGHALTTIDVQFTLDAIRDPKRGINHLRSLLDDVEAVELITATQVRLRMRKPNGYVLRLLAEIPILPMHLYKDEPSGARSGAAPVGSGPWKVASNKNGTIHLSANDKYWGAKPAISDIEFWHQPDAAAMMTAAKRGEIDVVPQLIAAHWPEQASAPGVTALFAPLILSLPNFRYMVFAVSNPPLDQSEVRQALGLLVDRQRLARSSYDGLRRAVLWPVWPTGPMPGAPTEAPTFDPKLAGALLDTAGWKDSDQDGIRDRNGEKLRLTMLALDRSSKDGNSEGQMGEHERFIEAARRVGVVIDLKLLASSNLEKRMTAGEFHLAVMDWINIADTDLRPMLATGGSANVGRYADPALDRLLDDVAQSPDRVGRVELAAKVSARLNEGWPMAGILAEAPQGLLSKRVRGVIPWDGWFDLRKVSFVVDAVSAPMQ
jgi:peptide/nickel transport system substrate-binding protein